MDGACNMLDLCLHSCVCVHGAAYLCRRCHMETEGMHYILKPRSNLFREFDRSLKPLTYGFVMSGVSQWQWRVSGYPSFCVSGGKKSATLFHTIPI